MLALMTLCEVARRPAGLPCRCSPQAPVTTPALAGEFLIATHAAFRGRVISGRPVQDTVAINAATGKAMTTPATDYKVAIVKWWGGTGFDTVIVNTVDEATLCGADMKIGEEYLFLSYNNKANRVGVSSCLPPRRPDSALDLMHLLDSAEVIHRKKG